MPTISRRLASAGRADPGDLKSSSLQGASPGSPTNLRSSSYGSASRRVVNREQQTGSTQDRTALGVQVSPRRPIWNVNRSSEPGLFAKQCVPSGKWCKPTAFRHSCARSSKRAGGLIPRIALDQCRVPERYRTRVPFRTPEREVAQAAQHFLKALGVSRWKRPAGSLIFCPHSSKHRAGAS